MDVTELMAQMAFDQASRGGQWPQQAMQHAPQEAPLEEPWVDPVSAFAGGFGGTMRSALGKGAGVVQALIKSLVSGTTGAAADYPIGVATEHIGERYPNAALPFNVVAGMGSGMTFERVLEEALTNPAQTGKMIKNKLLNKTGTIGGGMNNPFKGSAIKEPVYHGSNEELPITDFKSDRYGYYFSPNSSVSEQYGYVHEYYLNSPKHIDLTSDAGLEYVDSIESRFDPDELIDSQGDQVPLREIVQYGDWSGGGGLQDKFLQEVNKDGYTGVTMPDYHGGGENETAVVVFDKNNIKPVKDISIDEYVQSESPKFNDLVEQARKNRKK